MIPEHRDYILIDKIISVLVRQTDLIVHLKCFNQDEIKMLSGLVPEKFRSRIRYTYMEFYKPL